MKTKEELNAIKNDNEIENNKFAELSDEDLGQVIGGIDYSILTQNSDIEKDMATFQRDKILTQVAQSQLAQANQLPQGILDKLK